MTCPPMCTNVPALAHQCLPTFRPMGTWVHQRSGTCPPMCTHVPTLAHQCAPMSQHLPTNVHQRPSTCPPRCSHVCTNVPTLGPSLALMFPSHGPFRAMSSAPWLVHFSLPLGIFSTSLLLQRVSTLVYEFVECLRGIVRGEGRIEAT